MAVKSFDISGQNQFENYGRWKLLSSLVRLVFVPHLHFDVFIHTYKHPIVMMVVMVMVMMMVMMMMTMVLMIL